MCLPKEKKILTQAERKYRDNLGMESDIEEYAMLIIKGVKQ